MSIEELKRTPIDTLLSKEDKVALEALNLLILLRKAYLGNWKPDWADNDVKYVIWNSEGELLPGTMTSTAYLLSFPTEQLRDNFMTTFKNLLETAKALL